MDPFDKRQTDAVWQRVRGDRPPLDPAPASPAAEARGLDWSAGWLQSLLTEERAMAESCLALARRMNGAEAAVLRTLGQEARSRAACLAGMYRLAAGKTLGNQPVPGPGRQEPAQEVLRRLYDRSRQAMAAYEPACAHPVFGQVFTLLLQEQRRGARRYLELLGAARG